MKIFDILYKHVGHGSLAQLGEHLPYKQRVTGSSPVTSTTTGLREHCAFLRAVLPRRSRFNRQTKKAAVLHRRFFVVLFYLRLYSVNRFISS